MTTITFDTLKFTKRLKAVGFTEEQAEAFTEAQKDILSESTDSSLATKADILRLESEINPLKWMCGTTLGAVVAILVRLFIK